MFDRIKLRVHKIFSFSSGNYLKNDIADTLHLYIRLRSKHRMQTRHFDRISTLNATLFRLAVETVLFGVLACFSSAFLAVRRLQTDGQSGLVQNIRHTALLIGLIQSAEVGVLL